MRDTLPWMLREFPLMAGAAEPDVWFLPTTLDPQVFSEPHFGFFKDIFQAGETGEWKLTDWNGTDLADRRLVQRRTTAFFMDQHQH